MALAEALVAPDLSDDEIQKKLLLSHAITRMGTQGWLFITPLVLLRFTPGSLAGPACWGVATTLATSLLAPPLGSWADRTNRRFVVISGVVAQGVGVVGSTAVLLFALFLVENPRSNVPAAFAFICCSIVEALGTTLSDVTVKRDWSPRLFSNDLLRSTNSLMSQIDLVSKTVAPVLAGLLITPRFGVDAEAVGFVAVGVLNALSFMPQLRLLLQIYASRSEQLRVVPRDRPQGAASPSGSSNFWAAKAAAWKAWYHHPSGIQFLSLAYASLYLTVLTPNGALLTGYLYQHAVPTWKLSLFRGAGAFLGVLGVAAHPMLVRAVGRLADALSATWLAAFILVAVASFWKAQDTGGGTSAAMLVFMLAVCFARPGLYAFELGILNRSQEMADVRHRSAIGTVDAALTSVGTLVAYSWGLILDRPKEFYILVSSSAFFVCLGAVTYWMWMLFFHFVRHRHMLLGSGSKEDHIHTLQQEEALEDGWHEHFHYHPPSLCTVQ